MKKNADKLKKAKEIVENLVRGCLPKAEIVAVKITEDVGYYGDDILRVDVIHDSEKYVLNSNSTVGFAGVLSEELSDIGIEAFPLMSWISARDAGLKRKRTVAKGKRTGIAA